MKILLFDCDVNDKRKAFPNLALMKLSAFHKAKGHKVFLNFPLCQPNTTYISCVFTWNAKRQVVAPSDATLGGSGIDYKEMLPLEVEHTMPDYSLYPSVDWSMGFTSRGCPRKCSWCIVPQKEGNIQPWASIYEFWDKRHYKIMLLDNNLLASQNLKETLSDLAREKIKVDFNQGLDIRLLNEENVWWLKQVNTDVLRFAFDHISYEKAVRDGIQLLLTAGISSRKLSFYILVGFDDDTTAVERAKILKSYNVDIYPMIFKDASGKEPIIKTLEFFSLHGYHGNRHNLRKFQRVVS